MIIDGHAHMNHISYRDWLNEKGGDEGKKQAARMTETERRRPHGMNVALRLAQLDRNGIDFQVVTPGGGGLPENNPDLALATARVINDGMARLMEESKGRLIAGGTVPLAGFAQGGTQEMDRAVKTLGLKAITIPSHINGAPLDAPEFEPFWAQAAQLGAPVYIHPSQPAQHRDRTYEGDYDLSHVFGLELETVLMLSRLVFSGIMERYPALKVVGHHLGGGLPFWMGRITETYDVTNPLHEAQAKRIHGGLSKPLFDYFSRFYYDTAVGGNAAAIRCAVETFGASQVIFATDAPNGPGTGEVRLATYTKIIRSLNLPKEDEDKVLAGNTRKMLNLT